MGLMGEPIQKDGDLPGRSRRELENWVDVDIGKAEPREAGAKCFADVFGRHSTHFQERLKDRFVIGAGEFVGGEPSEDLAADFVVQTGRAKRGQEPPLDFSAG